MKKTKKMIGLVMAAAMVFSMAACGGSGGSTKDSKAADETKGSAAASTTEDYHVALISPMTGNEAQYGEMQKLGAQIAVDEINEAGGIDGRKVVLDVFDDENDTTTAATVAQKIIDDDRYDAAIGTFSSSNGLAMAPLFDEAKMPFFCAVSSDGRIATDYAYTFQQNIAADKVWPIMADNSVSRLDAKKVALVALNNDAGEYFVDYATEEFEKLNKEQGTELVATITYNEGEVSDFTSIIAQLKEAAPDLVMINVQYQDMAALLRQSDQQGFAPNWYCVESLINDAFVELAGDYAKGLYFHCTYFANSPAEGCVWLQEKCQELGSMNANLFTRMYYEGTMQILHCAANGGAGNREEMYQQLLKLGTWEGKTGNFEWTETRQCICDVNIVELDENNEWKLLED